MITKNEILIYFSLILSWICFYTVGLVDGVYSNMGYHEKSIIMLMIIFAACGAFLQMVVIKSIIKQKASSLTNLKEWNPK